MDINPEIFVFLWIDYEVPFQGLYRAVEIQQFRNQGKRTVKRFETGDPVSDWKAAILWILSERLELEWFPSNLVDWLNQGSRFTLKTRDGLPMIEKFIPPMIYTVGDPDSYSLLFESFRGAIIRPRKAEGGSVWKTRGEAQVAADRNSYRVYGVLADWERDTRPANSPKYPGMNYLTRHADLWELDPEGEEQR